MLVCGIASAQPDFTALRDRLLRLRGPHEENLKTRGATPELTTIKHLLRDWVESGLQSLSPIADESFLQNTLNSELERAGLFCDERCDSPDRLPDELGSLGGISLTRTAGHLVVETRVGILCGYDTSAYLYRWAQGHWQQIWESEQNDYTNYKPQSIKTIRVSSNDILTIGRNPWCSSNWHPSYVRLWQLDSPKQLLDIQEMTFVGDRSLGTQLSDDAVMFGLLMQSKDPGLLISPSIRRYLLGDRLERTDPVALSPRNFVDEWLRSPWEEIAPWSESALSATHTSLAEFSGEFGYPTMHCPSQPDMWQVSLERDDKKRYFLIRWQPPDRFRMLGVLERPDERCSEPDPDAERQPNLLFPPEP